MDQLQVADLILAYLVSQGVTDSDLIRKGCLEAAVSHLPYQGAPIDPATLLARTRQLWGLDVAPAVSSYISSKISEYQDTTLTPVEVLIEIAADPSL